MARLTKDERHDQRQQRRENERTRRATLKNAGTDARRQYFWGNLLRQRRQRMGG